MAGPGRVQRVVAAIAVRIPCLEHRHRGGGSARLLQEGAEQAPGSPSLAAAQTVWGSVSLDVLSNCGRCGLGRQARVVRNEGR